MSWNIYKSTDASAPTLNGTVGSLITLLDACLVNGYGAKPAAGWTKAFTGTNLAAYRMGSGATQYYLRVDDNGPGAGGARESRLIGYQTMSDVNTGTDAFPSTNQLYFRKSATLDATARPWYVAADDRTVIITQSFDSSVSYSGTYFGQFYSYVPNDLYGVCLIARILENNASYGSSTEALGIISASSSIATSSGHFYARDSTGLVKAVAFEKSGGIGPVPNNMMVGSYGFPNAADGSLILSPIYVRSVESTFGVLRGRLRGIWINNHNNFGSFATPGDTYSGTGDLAGKAFVFAGYASGLTVTNGGFYTLETSDTVPANA